MNAGTSQRIALTLLSTLLMIRLGRVYRGFMVEVSASNVKLAKRKKTILRDLTGRSDAAVQEALEHAKGSVKIAFLLLQGCDLDTADALLRRAGGRLRAAIALLEGVTGACVHPAGTKRPLPY
jgi:N-acetylmuramic acid 6-phosphate etherase